MSWNYGKALGEEARYRKKDILLGPGVNIYRTPLNGRNLNIWEKTHFYLLKWWFHTLKGSI